MLRLALRLALKLALRLRTNAGVVPLRPATPPLGLPARDHTPCAHQLSQALGMAMPCRQQQGRVPNMV